jgi:glycerate dehydrogenase
LFATSHVVSLHCPLTAETERMVDARMLARMRPDAIPINTARGRLIDEDAWAAALLAGRLAGAGLDTLSREPPSADHPLLHAPRCVVTPHMAWASLAARRRLMAATAENIRAFLAGRPINVVG